MLVYFDICAIQRPFDDHSQLRVRLEAEAVVTLIQLCEMGLFELVISAAHEIENGQNPYPERRAYAADVLSLLSTAWRVAPKSPSVRQRTFKGA